MVQIKITKAAKKHITDIYTYIYRDSPQSAAAVSESTIQKIDTLKKQADVEKIVKELGNPSIR
jgi:plasmid stabilization system protein ParE